MLPDGDGARVLEQVRAKGLDIRVVVTTGVSDPARLANVARLRPDLILTKPINLESLLRGLGLTP